jgi:membrane-bound lytic murein transglycosylase B
MHTLTREESSSPVSCPDLASRVDTRRKITTVIVAIVVIGLAACDGSPSSAGGTSSAGASTEASARPSSASDQGLPAPDVPIPADAARAADALTRTTAALRRAIDGWRGRGDPPQSVVLLALHQQRIYRVLARNPELARRTIARLKGPPAAQARDNVAATRDLFSLAHPVKSAKRFRTQRPQPAGTLLGHLRQAGRRFHVSWQVLAAVMHVETKFGRVKSASSAGAQGPMQFLPATWKMYGLRGNVHDPRDAVLGAANYLHASGAPGDYERALHAYNPDRRYVDAVLRHARQIKRDSRAYYAYYNWQVFVLTTRGDVRITGPRS